MEEINLREYFLSELDLLLEHALRDNVSPPIKGDITIGKIKWRGIKIVQRYNHPKIEIWVEQRGKKVTEPFVFEFKVR